MDKHKNQTQTLRDEPMGTQRSTTAHTQTCVCTNRSNMIPSMIKGQAAPSYWHEIRGGIWELRQVGAATPAWKQGRDGVPQGGVTYGDHLGHCAKTHHCKLLQVGQQLGTITSHLIPWIMNISNQNTACFSTRLLKYVKYVTQTTQNSRK